MFRPDIEGRIVSTLDEVGKIPDPDVRIAARFIFLELHPDEEIVLGYEDRLFEHNNGGKVEGTRPDLSVYFVDGSVRYIREITKRRKKRCIQTLLSLPIWLGKTDVVLSENNRIDLLPILIEYDPKSRQKRVMKNIAPDLDYGVWYGEDLEAIQISYPEYAFYHPSKISITSNNNHS